MHSCLVGCLHSGATPQQQLKDGTSIAPSAQPERSAVSSAIRRSGYRGLEAAGLAILNYGKFPVYLSSDSEKLRHHSFRFKSLS